MKINELKLNRFDHYKQKNNRYDRYYVFCIVYDTKDNEILEVKERFSKKVFDENRFRDELASKKNSLRKRVQFYYLPVSNNEQIIKDFIKFKENWSESRKELKEKNFSNEFFLKIRFILKNYYKSLIIFIFAIYSSFFYYTLTDIGIPVSTINVALQELLFIMLYYLSGPISLIVLYLLLLFSFFALLLIVFKFLAMVTLKYIKKPTIYFYFKEIGTIKNLYNTCIDGLLVIMILIYLSLLFFPLAHMLYDIVFKQIVIRADKFQSDYLFGEYLHRVGYPKIAIENGKYYIFVGHDKSYEHLYDLNLTKQYIVNQNSKSYEKYCRNITANDINSSKIYEFMRNSPYMKAYNTKLVKIKDSNLTYKNLGYITKDINLTKTYDECKLYIKNKVLHAKENSK